LLELARNVDIGATIAAAGAIPLLVQLLVQLVPGSSALVQVVGALRELVRSVDIALTIAAAGAIPPLVQLLAPGSSTLVLNLADFC
jgi:hypothetical protein